MDNRTDSIIRRIISYGMNPLDTLERVCDKYILWWKRRRSFAHKYIFEDRSKKSENLLLIVAGFQEFYWDTVFGRVERNCRQFDESIDVCVCVPRGDLGGGILDNVRLRCEKLGWSLVYLYDDLLAQAQNTAIKLHPNAKWIYKIDEDIIISDQYFSKMKRGFLLAEKQLFAQMGFATPLLNLNAACVHHFLETTDKLSDMYKIFGDIKIRFPQEENDPVHRSEDFARWVWNNSLPFDQVAKEVENTNVGKIFQANVRLSIGAILFTRNYWEQIGFFEVARTGAMGVEEGQMNAYSFNIMQSIAIVGDTFAGHLGFFSQKNACRELYENNKEKFN